MCFIITYHILELDPSNVISIGKKCVQNHGAKVAADIETLIRQALARQNGFDPVVRQKIYQSSRNALAKMIARSDALPPEIIKARSQSLEDTISKIENEFSLELDPAPIATTSEPPVEILQQVELSVQNQISHPETFVPQQPEPPAFQEITPAVQPDLATTTQPQQGVAEVRAVAEPSTVPPVYQASPEAAGTRQQPAAHQPSVGPDPVEEYAKATPQNARPKRKKFRYLVWLMMLMVMAIVGWVAYSLSLEYLTAKPTKLNNPQIARNNGGTSGGEFFTILDPTQPSALVTGGNGTAEILSAGSQPVVRITSVRQPGNLSQQADPIYLELAPGILKDIAGKKVTVEIFAKSGGNRAATFSVSCDFGTLGKCGRKRFRIGLQPEAVIFSIQISGDYVEGQKVRLALNTDVTSAAAQTGKGAKIDIIYARIKIVQ